MFQQYKYSIPKVFDAPSSLFYRGKSDSNYDNSELIKNAIPFNEIYAIQVISRFSYSNNHARYIYELNLVLKNRMRENLIGHSNKIAILENAQTLSQFLSVPLWNAM